MKSILLIAAIALSTAGVANANSFDTGGSARVVYKGRPLAIDVPVGRERLIEFGKAVQIAVPSNIRDSVEVESIAGTIYMTATKAFDERRFRVRNTATGEILLLDISAVSGSDDTPLRVIDQEQANTLAQAREDALPEQVEAPGLITITRHAFQQVYAPDRLIAPVQGIFPAKLKNKKVLRNLVPGSEVSATPLAQWRVSDGRYVTALYIRNHSLDRVFLDPRLLRVGEGWETAAFRDGVLTGAGRDGDSTTLVVVADRSWNGSTQWLR